jgi:para-nitrobenzyl esterase
MQWLVFDDMVFRDKGPSEDCLYLNVWAPETESGEKLPVMVWIFGGGFVAGGTSEPRQDGETLAKKGVVVVSMNYRLGVFGFLAHPELSKESGGHSGNYGLLDQLAALQWVKRNIAAFGGDPSQVTIFGESAGSFSVSAHMASPLSLGLFHRAIGQSGSLLGSWGAKPLDGAEQDGVEFAGSLGASSLKALRALAADKLLAAHQRGNPFRFGAVVDGNFFKENPREIFAAGRQNQVPLLAGWNRDEGNFGGFLKGDAATVENFEKRAREEFKDKAADFLTVYRAKKVDEVQRAAQDIDGDKFIAFSTWKWLETQVKASKAPAYRYRFDQPLPGTQRANHSAEIESVFGTQASKKVPWTDLDLKLGGLMMDYWTNFAKRGDPNAKGLPNWPLYDVKGGYPVMHLSLEPGSRADAHRDRYLFLDALKP